MFKRYGLHQGKMKEKPNGKFVLLSDVLMAHINGTLNKELKISKGEIFEEDNKAEADTVMGNNIDTYA
jgi:hypothetical protein